MAGLYDPGQQATETDVGEIKAVTDLLPDAGALTSIAQESTLEGVGDTVDEIDEHSHNIERWWGIVALPDETNAIESNVDRPVSCVSGNDDWGVATAIKGTADNPVLATMTEFDAHRLLVVDLDDDTTPWKVRLIWGTGTSAAAIIAHQWSEAMVITNAVPGNRAGGVPIDVRMPPVAMATKLWAQSWNQTNSEVLQFFWGAHGYPYPH